MTSVDSYLRPSVSNGHPREQALIRRWWQEVHRGRGALVWEYYLGNCYLDAMWFPDTQNGGEFPGVGAPAAFPILGVPVVLCEAKRRLTAELIGQALVYRSFARRAGADVRSTTIFAETAHPEFKLAAEDLGLEVVLP